MSSSQKEVKEQYHELTLAMEAHGDNFKVDSTLIGHHNICNVCLNYLGGIRETLEEQTIAAKLALNHFKNVSGMTNITKEEVH